jgi:hypothetical protein
MSVLAITAEVESRAKQIVTYAQEHPITHEEAVAMMKGEKRPVGMRPEYQMEVPIGFKVVYSWERQPLPLGWCTHISVSTATPGKAPHPAIVDAILLLFEIGKKHDQADYGYMEDIGNGCEAVNLLFKT